MKKDTNQPKKDLKPIPEVPENNIEEIKNLTDQLLRTQADFENYKKRSQADKENSIHFANADLISQLLPVLDNFKRAAEHTPKTEDKTIQNWVAGIQAVERQFEDILQQMGIVEIETVPGHVFDPQIHEAISHEPSNLPVDTVIAVTEIGYILNDKVLRPAKVKVSSGQK